MALIGEMKYLTIGGNTYSIPEPELPIASSSTLGGIKVGSGLTIDSSTGVLTATGTSITIDTVMSDSSTNTVQNKVIKSYVDTNIPTKVSDLQNDSGFTANTGTVTSVRVQASSPLSSSTSTAQSTSLNTTISFSNQNKNLVLAGPSSGSSAAPSFRSLVADDIPDLSSIYLTSFTETDPTVPSWAKASTKPSYALSEITSAGDIQAIEALTGTSGLLKKTAANTWTLDTTAYTTNTGTVTSVGAQNATNGGLTISGSPVTTSGTITIGHSNVLTSAQTTQALYPIKIDKNGHISSYGTAVTSLPASDVYSWAKEATKPSYTASEVGAVATSAVGAASGVAPLNASSKIDSTYLPSYVDDIIEGYYYNSKFWKEAAHTTEITGEAGKIYVDLSTDKTYRYSGTGYVEVSSGSLVTITRNLTSGTKSATINVDGTDYDIYSKSGTVTSVQVQATSPVVSSQNAAQSSTLNTTISLADNYGDTKNPYASKTKNYVLAAPSNANGAPSFRALVASDIPDLSSTYLTSYTETDPIFSASAAANISSTDISDWNAKGSVSSVGLTNATNGGLTISGSPVTSSGSITVGHTNVLTSAQATQAVYPIKIDKNGHISAYGSAVSIPSKTSDLTNDSGFITDAGVTSFNGDTGAITYTAPVTSVNGNTGAVTISVPSAATATPVVDGTAAVGSSSKYAKEDHVHPTDTSRAATSTVTTQASIGSDGLITYKNSGNTSLYTVQLPLFDGSSGASSLDFLPLGGGTITGNLTVNGTTTLGSTLGVSGKITGGNGLDITGATTTQGNLSVNGTLTSTGLITGSGGISTTILTTSSNATIGGNLSVSGTTTSTGLLTASGGISTTTLTTSGNTTIGGTLQAAGATTLGSTLDVTGTTTVEDVTVNGFVHTTNRRSALLSNIGAGWHRVLEFAPTTVEHRLGRAGIIIDFDITRFGTTNETHHVSLSLIETNAKFYGEFSNSNTQLIDKIRYTYDSSKGYVDIHLSSAYSANVAVDYQVAASAGSFRGLVTTKSLAAVADSPSGETVMVSYDFISSTDRTGSMTAGSGATSLSNVHIVQHGKMVNISGYAQGTFTASTTGYALGIITGVSMPSTAYLYCNGGCGSAANYTSNCAYLCITKSNGVLSARVSVDSTYIIFNITYFID